VQQPAKQELVALQPAQTRQAPPSHAQQAMAPQAHVGVQAEAEQAQVQAQTAAQEAIAHEVHEAEVVADTVQSATDKMFTEVGKMLNLPERVGPTATLDTPADSPAPAQTNETKETIGKKG
jgi:hypothetical protein